jgi:Anti-sigma factor NepR
VTKPTTTTKNPPVKVGGIKIFEAPNMGPESGCSGSAKEMSGGPCPKKAASKSDIADQIGLHLRSVYDDILAQPVPVRFRELLRQLESASEARSSKDGM